MTKLKPFYLQEINSEISRDQKNIYKFYETVKDIEHWARDKVQTEKTNIAKDNSDKNKRFGILNNADSDLLFNNLSADLAHLSPLELWIWKLSDIKFDKDGKNVTLHFNLPSEFRYEPHVHDFINEIMNRLTHIMQAFLREYSDTAKLYKTRKNKN